MRSAPIIKLATDHQRVLAKSYIDRAPIGWIVQISEETRNARQNRLMWPLLKDLQEQVESMATFSTDDIKLRFMHALGQEMRFLPELEGSGMFPVGQRSSLLTVRQFAGLIELIFQYGAKNGVLWSRNSIESFGEIKEGK